jgi:TonB family protein
MFHTLVASGPQPSAGMPRMLASAALHVIVVAAAIVATQGRVPPPRSAARETSAVFIAPRPVGRPVPSLPELGPGGGAAPAPSWPLTFEAPQVATGELTSSLPTVSDLVSLARQRSDLPNPGSLSGGTGAPWAADSVDEPVEVLDQATLRYPPALAQAGIPGRVEVEFVVDTSGWVEGGSVRTLASTRPEFETEARAAIARTRYRPARAHGRVVRQLVRQTVSFRPLGGRHGAN